MAAMVARELDPGTVAGALGLAIVAGLALPQHYGLLPPLLAIVTFALLAERHHRRLSTLADAGISRSLSAQPWGRRVALSLSLALPAVVISTVAARGVSSIVVAYPAAIWGLMAAAFAGLVMTLLPVGRGRWLVVLVLASAVPAAGIAGQRWEAAGAQSRGFAHTGTMLGIHPFQTTAIVVDGFGPHDLPVNDYVEPDGSRGYGPDEIAAALQNSIRALGVLHYRYGPARARMAFENVRVTAVSTEPLRESLDREPVESHHSRLRIESGTTGQRSSIQFVCPGQRSDPRGLTRDAVNNPMCPSKYITEASAGLSVTGRWTGYTEGRGQERFGLARQWLGGTRTDDAVGGRVIEREVRWGAWLLLAGLALVTLPRRERGSAQEGLSAIAGGIGVMALLVVGWVVVLRGDSTVVHWFERAPSWERFDVRAWTPALAIAAVAVATLGPGQGGRIGSGPVRIGAIPLALGVLASASSLAALQWLRPDLYTVSGALAFERFVGGAADQLWEAGFGFSDWSVLEMEAAVGSVVAVLLAGAALAMLGSWGTSIDPPAGARGRHWARALAVVAVVAVAAFVTVSRKTQGTAALLPAAMAILLVHGSCMGLMAIGRRPRPSAIAVHLALIGLALWVVMASVAPLPSHVFVQVCTGAGVAAALAALIFIVPRSRASTDARREPPEKPPVASPEGVDGSA